MRPLGNDVLPFPHASSNCGWVRFLAPPQIGVVQLGAVQVGAVTVGAARFGAEQIGAVQVGAAQVGANSNARL